MSETLFAAITPLQPKRNYYISSFLFALRLYLYYTSCSVTIQAIQVSREYLYLTWLIDDFFWLFTYDQSKQPFFLLQMKRDIRKIQARISKIMKQEKCQKRKKPLNSLFVIELQLSLHQHCRQQQLTTKKGAFTVSI